MKLFVGLGNPGSKYDYNRHNFGFMVLDRIASSENASPWKSKFNALHTKINLDNTPVLLLKPQSFMNLSGQSVGETARFYNISTSDITVFHDELDLPVGKVKYKKGGGHAGHNGLRSLHQHIGDQYCRVRLGIDHPGRKELVAHYVLGNFSKQEQSEVNFILDNIERNVHHLAGAHPEKFSNDLNKPTSKAPTSSVHTKQSATKLISSKNPDADADLSSLQKLMKKFS